MASLTTLRRLALTASLGAVLGLAGCAPFGPALMPDIQGFALERARYDLGGVVNRASIRVTRVRSGAKPNTVITQAPEPGAEISSRKDPVWLTVSAGNPRTNKPSPRHPTPRRAATSRGKSKRSGRSSPRGSEKPAGTRRPSTSSRRSCGAIPRTARRSNPTSAARGATFRNHSVRFVRSSKCSRSSMTRRGGRVWSLSPR